LPWTLLRSASRFAEKKRALGEAALGDGGAAASLTREDLLALLA